MSISLIVSVIGAIAAAVGVGLLLARCLRAPRTDLIAWAVALLGLLTALIAQALGHLMGFGGLSFRAMEIGAQLIAPLALIMGLAEVTGTSLIGRFIGRLYISAFGLVGLVILGSDPLSGAAFTKAWPSPAVYYQLIPNKLLQWGLVPVCLLMAVITVGLAVSRSRRLREWGAATRPTTAAGIAVLALVIPILAPALSDHLGLALPLSSLFALVCLLAAGLTWYAAVTLERTPVAALHDSVGAGHRSGHRDTDHDDLDRDAWGGDQWHGADRPGGYEPIDDSGQGVYRGGGLYRDEPPRGGLLQDETGYGWPGRPDGDPAEGYQANGSGGDYDSRELGPYGPGGDSAVGYGTGSYDDEPDGGRIDEAGNRGARSRDAGPLAAGGPPPTREQLFGQIAIYTLIEDTAQQFDRLTERVVGQVRAGEPDTLVFIVHAVPSAPMQRILYEVYRDRDAYDRHLGQPYIAEFESDRQPFVLATNVIELGLQQAKISPFPSIADLFGEPGYDTSGFERPDYTREYGTSAGQRGAGQRGAGQHGAGQHGARS